MKQPFIILIWAATLLFYHPALSTYFSQDDFFHFEVSQTDGTLRGFLDLFGFHSFEERKIAFYRPITRELPFHLSYTLFGLNPLPLRLLSFFLVFANSYLTYLLAGRLFKNKKAGLLSAFFVGISSVNTAALYYLAGGIQTLGATFFLLLCLVLFERYKLLSFVAFLLALGSQEQAAVLPLLLSGLLFVQYPPRVALGRIVRLLWPHVLTVIVFAVFNYSLIGFSKGEVQYTFDFSIKRAANTLSWYVIWALGLPEMLIDFVLPGLKLNPSLLRYWPHYYKPVFFGFFVCVAMLALAAFYAVRKGAVKSKLLWFLVIWFLAGMLPVLFLPQHKSTHYLYPVLPAFWGIVSFLLLQRKGPTRFVVAGFVFGVIVLNLFSALAARELYWAASRGRVAQKLVLQVKSQAATVPAGSGIYFRNDPDYPFVAQEWGSTSKQASFVLNGEDALQLLYNDPTLRVFYEDLGGVPEDFPKDKLVTVVAEL